MRDVGPTQVSMAAQRLSGVMWSGIVRGVNRQRCDMSQPASILCELPPSSPNKRGEKVGTVFIFLAADVKLDPRGADTPSLRWIWSPPSEIKCSLPR